MNESGQPVGSWGCGFDSSFPWIGIGGLGGTILPLPPGSIAAGARVINDVMTNTGGDGAGFGEIAGIANMPNDRTFFYSGNSYSILPLIEGGTASFIEGINDAPILAGYSANYVTWNPPDTALIWQDAGIEPIVEGRAFGINARGQVTGVSGALNTGVGFIWNGGRVETLPPITGGTTSQGIAINNSGHVAGVGQIIPQGQSTPVLRSFLWQAGEMIVLPAMPGYKNTRVSDVNDFDEVVGYGLIPIPPETQGGRAFIWRKGVLVDLNDFNVLPSQTLALVAARAITNNGVILVSLTAGTAKLIPVYGPLGDVNCDDVVNAADLLILLQHWGQPSSESLPAARCDLDNDGAIGVPDLLLLLAHWG